MKILQVGKFYYPSRGGIETVVKNLSESLSSAGVSVSVLCYSNTIRGTREQRNGVSVRKVSSLATLLSQPISPLFPFHLIREARRSDLIHLHLPNPLAELAGLFLTRRKALVVTYHSDVVRQRWLMPVYRRFLSRLLKRADRILVATPEHVEFSPILPRFKEKCVVSPFGLDPGDYDLTPEAHDFLNAIQLRKMPYVLFVGRMVGYKGVDVLLRALQGTAISAVLIGEGPLRARYEDLARSLGVSEQVQFKGEIQDSAEFLALLHGCEALVLPSRSANEAFGIVLIEAMACGKPVISSRLASGIRYVNSHDVSGLQVEPDKPEELRSAILKIMRDSSTRDRLGEGAKDRFRELFTLERMLDTHMRVYRETIEERCSR